MTTTFYAIDNEFAASTGDNVGSGDGTSTFDYPPNGSKDLVITSNEGNDTPYLFDVGDTYDISFGGNGGTTLEDAVVIRSDDIDFSDGNAVVFEGTDPDGNVVQVVWSPGFDLEDWYWDNFDAGQSPGFFTGDQDVATEYQAVCFTNGTNILSARGLVSVEDLQVGDLVQTLDAGLQPLTWVGRKDVPGWGRLAPVLFAPGTIGNTRPLRLSQQHRVLHRSFQAEVLFGTSEVLLPAKAMVNGKDVMYAPVKKVTYFHLLFEQHHVVLAEGAECESLFLGDMALGALDKASGNELREVFGPKTPQGHHQQAARMFLTYREALVLTGFKECKPPSPILHIGFAA